jgi:RNA polymerase sigma-70 factor (ECF subfamily)
MDMLDKTDEAIAAEIQKGDTELFAEIIKRYEEKLSRYARRFILDDDEAKDSIQETFIKSYVNIQSFDTGRKFSSWIYRIAHNEFINALKKKNIGRIISVFDLDVILPHLASKERAEKEAEKKELRRMLDECLNRLNPKYREPLILYYFEEMDYRQIADILTCRFPRWESGCRGEGRRLKK